MSGTIESTDDDVGGSVLAELAARREVLDGLASQATIVDQHSGPVELALHERLWVSESRKPQTLPKSRYDERRRSHVDLDSRWAHTPTDFVSTDVDYISAETPSTCSKCDGAGRNTCPTCQGSETESCPDCGGAGVVDCGVCDGAGENTCSTCEGSGSVTETERTHCERCDGSGTLKCPDCRGTDDDCERCDGEGIVDCPECDRAGVIESEVTVPCSTCDGSGSTTCASCDGEGTESCERCDGGGSITCRKCSGEGDVRCGRCAGDGETVQATVGALTFDYAQNLDIETDVIPHSVFRPDDGTVVETTRPVDDDRPAGTGADRHLYRHEVTRSRVDCEYVEYVHDDRRYWVTRVDGELRFEDFPNDPEHLEASLDEAEENDVFQFRPRVATGEALATSGRRLLTDLVKYLAATAGLLVVLLAASIVASIGGLFGQSVSNAVFYGIGAVAGVGVGAGAFTLWWEDRETGEGPGSSQRPYSRWDLLLPAGLGVAVAVGFVGSVGNELLRWQAAVLALGLWAGRVGTWLDYEGNRLAYLAEQRSRLLDRLSVDDATLASHGLTDRLPPTEWTLDPTFFRRAGLLVVAVGWGGGAATLAALLLAGFVSTDVAALLSGLRPYVVGFVAVTLAALAATLVPRTVD